MLKEGKKVYITDCIRWIGMFFILSIPMMPVFTKTGYTSLGILSGCLLLLFYSKNKKMFFTSFELMQLVFTILMLISLLYAPSFSSSWGHIKGNIRNIVFSFIGIRCFSAYYKDEKIAIQKFFDVFLLGTILISIYTLIVEPSTNGYYVRLGRIVFDGEYGTYMTYSYSLIIAFGWLTYKLFNKEDNSKYKTIYFLGLIFLFYCALLTGTKKCIIAIIMFVLLFVFIKNSKNMLRLLISGVIILLLGIMLYILIMNNRTLYLSIGRRFESFFNFFSEDQISDGSTIKRHSFIEAGIKYFWKSPILGNGIASFKTLYNDEYGIFMYSHNNFVEILCNLGIVGFILYYGWQLYILLILRKESDISDCNNINNFFLMLMLIFLVLDYGTVSYDKIQYLIAFNAIDFYIMDRRFKVKKDGKKY